MSKAYFMGIDTGTNSSKGVHDRQRMQTSSPPMPPSMP